MNTTSTLTKFIGEFSIFASGRINVNTGSNYEYYFKAKSLINMTYASQSDLILIHTIITETCMQKSSLHRKAIDNDRYTSSPSAAMFDMPLSV